MDVVFEDVRLLIAPSPGKCQTVALGGEVIREVPFVYVPNVVRKVTDLLTHNERYYCNSNWCNVLTLVHVHV